MGRKEKIPKSISRLCHSCEAVSDAIFYPRIASNSLVINYLCRNRSILGGWHPDAHRAMETIAVNIASRTLSSLRYARAMLFQRHAALLVANNAACLMSGFDFEV